MRNEPQTRSALNAIRARLVAAGLRVSIRRRGSLGVLAVGVFGGGVTRLVANSFGWLDLSITLVSTAVGVAIWGTARRTRAGVRTLRTLRDRYPCRPMTRSCLLRSAA